MNEEQLQKALKLHKKWLNNEEGGIRANLTGADLTGADLTGADLTGANLSYSCLPLWLGSLKVNMDDEQIKQLLYHTLSIVKCSNNVSKTLKESLLTETNLNIAREFYRAEEYNIL